jgi:hypothetical protein
LEATRQISTTPVRLFPRLSNIISLTSSDTSEEAKQHSREVLQNAENGSEIESASSRGDKNPNNVAGGLKATLNNPNTSDEAKESAKERLNNM